MATDSTNSPTSSTTHSHIENHPDIMSLRDRYAAVSDKPLAGLVEGLCLLTGLYLAISPWVVGFQGFTSLRVTNLVVGLALAVLAMGFGSVLERTHGLGWVAIAIGVWTIVAPWAVSGTADTTKTITNNAIVGGVACLLGLATMAMGLMRRRAR
jgi:hypothetical protein